ncbi:2-amino-4-hydroxy-6-hydroxymethyldihydropteridine diphosphokinase [Deinococcus koreensis]|uniref:2-amino-4-hydroxy-6-hydroxymethyldihydropteridine diphosphokinase n=1 Tax=Deinococcus koreensis TaxID=2054903 RepID=A0A2K3UXW0_9DEIO|nr:2-amino-4-hydroxy-6-hydroxymethyldihydropteridine diphosphokinase [Deinococcus koreensis]PNY81377.1 2-amino-4-hydroxy-6-hydroxymethyldihydropteridine diphosphokinase [Deinococcus koreensis]
MSSAFVALGANLGRPLETLRWAVRELAGLGTVRAVSGLYRTAPVGGPPNQPDYLNAALWLDTSLAPEPLLHALHEAEAQAGRQRRERWEARVLDLDLILYDDLVMPGPPELPHPRAWERAFVLAPLSDLNPELRHPQTGESGRAALLRVGSAGIQREAPADWVSGTGQPTAGRESG